MSRKKTILVLGLLVAVMPFLGFPTGLRNFFFVVLGLVIATLSALALWGGRRYYSQKVSETVYEESRPDRSEVVMETEENYTSEIDDFEKGNNGE